MKSNENMSSFLEIFRDNLRHNFGATVFMLVVGTIALVFVVFLIFDYFKTMLAAARRKKKHREEKGV
ncbi:MAG: hypothetical protein ABIQ35_09680 [Verrucomicrobiota bacterium]